MYNKLIYFIRLLHLILLVSIISAPLLPKYYLLKIISLLIFITINWKITNTCVLTKIEYYLMNYSSIESGFIFRLINPLYKFDNEKIFNINLEYITYSWLLLLILIYNLK